MQKGILAVLLVLVLIALVAVIATMSNDKSTGNIELADTGGLCRNAGGQWIAQHEECDFGLTQSPDHEAWCKDMGGSFDSCASPCRYQEGTSVCITACQVVCKL